MVGVAKAKIDTKSRAVFLDRDGVINRAIVRNGRPYPPPSLADMEILPGVSEAVANLKKAGLLTIVVTNQPDVATGKQDRTIVESMNDHLRQNLKLDDLRTCFHEESEGCTCYKPRPGMLVAAAENWNIDLNCSFMVGDRWRDVGAGQAVGCKTFFIDYGYDEECRYKPDMVVSDLAEASRCILSDV